MAEEGDRRRRFWCLDCSSVAATACEDGHPVLNAKVALQQQVQDLQTHVPEVFQNVQVALLDLNTEGDAVVSSLHLVGGRAAHLQVQRQNGLSYSAILLKGSLEDKLLKLLATLLAGAGHLRQENEQSKSSAMPAERSVRKAPRFWCLDCGAVASAACEDSHPVLSARAALRQHVRDLLEDVPQLCQDLQVALLDVKMDGTAAVFGLQLLNEQVASALRLQRHDEHAFSTTGIPRNSPEDWLLRFMALLLAKKGALLQQVSGRETRTNPAPETAVLSELDGLHLTSPNARTLTEQPSEIKFPPPPSTQRTTSEARSPAKESPVIASSTTQRTTSETKPLVANKTLQSRQLTRLTPHGGASKWNPSAALSWRSREPQEDKRLNDGGAWRGASGADNLSRSSTAARAATLGARRDEEVTCP